MYLRPQSAFATHFWVRSFLILAAGHMCGPQQWI
jgi:hypothetical protein